MAAGWGVDRDSAIASGGVSTFPHSSLTGLTSGDDHTQYTLLAGRSGGQTIYGGTAAGENLTLHSTAHATKGSVIIASGGGNVQIGGGTTASLLKFMEPSGSGTNFTAFKAQAQAGDVTYILPAADATTSGQMLSSDAAGNLAWASVTALAPASGTAAIVGGGATASTLRFMEPSGSGSNYTEFKAQAQSGNVTYILPSADATVSGYALKSDGAGNLSWGQAGGSDLKNSVNQSSHGFSVGDWLYFTGSVYAKAKADVASTSDTVGVVSSVTDSDNFFLQSAGYITGLSGLTSGSAHFLSASTAGAITATEPSTVGQITKPVLIATSTTTGYVVLYRGVTVGTATSSFTSDVFSGDNSTTAFTLSVTPIHKNNCFVSISGVLQQKSTYSVSGTTLTFTSAPPTGTSNIEVVTTGSVSIGTPSDGTVTTAKIVDSSVTSTKLAAGALFTAGTYTTLSGTAFAITGLPAGVTYVRIHLKGASFNATYQAAVQLGTGGSYTSSGYSSARNWTSGSGTAGLDSPALTSGFSLHGSASWAAAGVVDGTVELFLMDPATNLWQIRSDIFGSTGGVGYSVHTNGFVALAGALERVKVYDADAAASFDAGTGIYYYR